LSRIIRAGTAAEQQEDSQNQNQIFLHGFLSLTPASGGQALVLRRNTTSITEVFNFPGFSW
jgi:hypothetical protein